MRHSGRGQSVCACHFNLICYRGLTCHQNCHNVPPNHRARALLSEVNGLFLYNDTIVIASLQQKAVTLHIHKGHHVVATNWI